jgi:hypothetical protein
MKEFFVGLLVLISLLLLSIIAAMIMPMVLLMSVFLQSVVYLAFIIFAVWLVGKITLWGIERNKKGKVEIVEDAQIIRRETPRRKHSADNIDE